MFLDIKFIECFYKNHPNIQHIFILDKNLKLYSHIFKLRLTQTMNYLTSNFILTLLFRVININVLYLTNSFITNIPSYHTADKININNVINAIKSKHNFFLIVIPDFLFKNLKGNMKSEFTKVEVEEEMILYIKKRWVKIDNYINDLKSKYRKKLHEIILKSACIKIKEIEYKKAKIYKEEIATLFEEIIKDSKFSGPKFNTETLICLLENNHINLYGYFLNNNLIAFSSEIYNDNILYSYYVGFNKKLNYKYSLYSRILIETIKNAINLKAEKIVFGRTANEYKSNFGATPIQSFIFLKTNKIYLSRVFKILFKKLRVKPWETRTPFKQEK